jgi:Spy/CpxP family protein refolding chaperone
MRLDNSKRNLSLLGLVLTLAVTLPTFAQESGANSTQATRPAEGQQQPMKQDPLETLQLTGEQRAAIRAIRITTRDEQMALAQRLRRANRAIDEALDENEPNEARLELLVKEFGEAQAALERLKVSRELRIRRVLTPAQNALLTVIRRQAQETQEQQRMQNPNNERRGLRNRPGQSNSIAPGPDLKRNGLPRRP